MLRLVDPQRFAARVRPLLAEQPGAYDRAMSFGMDRGLEPIGGAWARGHDLATTCHDVNDIMAAVPVRRRRPASYRDAS
jgi:hypothetical protein